jgi:DNA-binding transcriptional MerR regulator
MVVKSNKNYSINEICKLCNVTRKQLRYYEERGLLTDVSRDFESNYRYYSWQNIHEILVAKELKDIGFSINKIGNIFSSSSLMEIQESMKNQMMLAEEELHLSIARYEACTEKYARLSDAISLIKLQMVENYREDESTKETNYEIVDYPDQDVIALCYDGTFKDTEKKYVEKVSLLRNIAEEYQAIISGSLINIYDGHLSSRQCTLNDNYHKIEVCFPVKEIKQPCPYYKKLKGFKGLSTYHIGSYENIFDKSYANLMQWAKNNGYELENRTIEHWLISSLTTKNDKYWVTKIHIPFANK